jgi:hypothetical protein
MNTKLRLITTLFAAGAAAAIIVAPSASAGMRTCADGGASTICENPGNVEIHTGPEVQAPRVYGPFSSPIPFLFN